MVDLEEWEILPDDGYLEIQEDGGKKNFSRKFLGNPKIDLKMDYFMCPSRDSHTIPKNPSLGNPDSQVREELEVNKAPILTEAVWETDKVSQVSFNKTKENEFVDMKSGVWELDNKSEVMEGSQGGMELDSIEGKNGGLGVVWKWSLSGIGAICSFGVAAATVCVVILGNGINQRNKQQNQQVRFQIYAGEKRIKEVVHHATKLNEAISVQRGVPLTSAHVTFGGHYDVGL